MQTETCESMGNGFSHLSVLFCTLRHQTPMPGTAKLLGVTDAFDPHQNLNGAARYFTQQLARFKDVRLALAAYNAGPHRVQQYGGIPPFTDTRHYVASITAATGLRAPAADPASVTPVAEASTPSPDTQRSISVWQY